MWNGSCRMDSCGEPAASNHSDMRMCSVSVLVEFGDCESSLRILKMKVKMKYFHNKNVVEFNLFVHFTSSSVPRTFTVLSIVSRQSCLCHCSHHKEKDVNIPFILNP